MSAPLRVFVTATDTNVGKTEVCCALLANLARRGERPSAFKPYESGGAPLEGDGAALQAAAGGWQPLERIVLHRFRLPLAPGIAARAERRRPSWSATLGGFRALGDGPLVVEGAGGLFVPLDSRHDVIDLIDALALPVIVVARAGLGTINHTTLTLQALSARGARVVGVVLNKTVPGRDVSERFNQAELERRFPRVRFAMLPFVEDSVRRRAVFVRRLQRFASQPLDV